jgi:hypothetical protein
MITGIRMQVCLEGLGEPMYTAIIDNNAGHQTPLTKEAFAALLEHFKHTDTDNVDDKILVMTWENKQHDYTPISERGLTKGECEDQCL